MCRFATAATQENGAAADVVCTVQSVNGAAQVAAGDAGLSVSASCRRAAQRGEIGLQTDLARVKSPPSETAGVNSRRGGCYADLPLGLNMDIRDMPPSGRAGSRPDCRPLTESRNSAAWIRLVSLLSDFHIHKGPQRITHRPPPSHRLGCASAARKTSLTCAPVQR